MISLLNESIAELKPKQGTKPVAAEPPAPAPPPATQEKWSRENHPAFKKVDAPVAADDKDDATPASYQVNDTVLAKWVSGDKAFYPGRITSITGSSTAPIYIVKFKSYDTTETLRAKDIRPVSNKRKADGAPVSTGSSIAGPAPASAPVAATGTGVVAAVAASIYPDAKRDAEQNAGDAAAKAHKPKKIKANKELEAGKSKWQDFNSKSKFGKSQKKDSMFRTGDGVNARGNAATLIPLLFMANTYAQLALLARDRLCAKTLRGADTYIRQTMRSNSQVLP